MKSETDTNKNMILFQERLKELRGNNKLQDIAKDIGISRASLGYYENGDRKPDIEVLLKLANYYHVSCDFLLGLTTVKNPNIDNRVISEKTGLNEQSINVLSGYQKNATRSPEDAFDTAPALCILYLDTLNRIINPNSDILTNIANYLYLTFDSFYDDATYSDEDIYSPISELGLFDKRLGISFAEDYDYLSQVFLLMVQKKLMNLREIVQKQLPKRITPTAHNDDLLTESFEDDDIES